jgi:hypothetical protein
VKRSRFQSHELPRRWSWLTMMSWCSRVTFQVSSTNFSRPISRRLVPRFFSAFSTTCWVAMPAWSQPGTQSVSSPSIRW